MVKLKLKFYDRRTIVNMQNVMSIEQLTVTCLQNLHFVKKFKKNQNWKTLNHLTIYERDCQQKATKANIHANVRCKKVIYFIIGMGNSKNSSLKEI